MNVSVHVWIAALLHTGCYASVGEAPLDPSLQLADLSDADIGNIADRVQRWTVWPSGSEGYATAEVTIGGVDTDALSSKTLECKDYPGLYFIGEVVDVTGHLGGHNFQWAWASGHAAGEVV